MNVSWSRRGFLEMLGAGLALSELSLGAQAPANAPNPARDAANVERDVVFGKGGALDLSCDIYKPTGSVAPKRMAVLHFHGGGWAGGDKSGLAARLQPMSALGYVNIAAQYRLSGVARWPAALDDVKTAIRWTRANAARLQIDPARVAVAGYSAGAYLALFAAGTQNEARFEGSGGNAGVPTTVAACLSYYAPTGAATGPQFRVALPLPPGSSEAAWQDVEIGAHLKGMPPTALFQGTADTLVAPEISETLAKQLRIANVPCELYEFAGVSHEFNEFPEFAEACSRLNDFFLDRYVINPKTYPAFGAGRGRGQGGGGRGRGGQ